MSRGALDLVSWVATMPEREALSDDPVPSADRRPAGLDARVVEWADRLAEALQRDHLHTLCAVFVMDPASDILWLAAHRLDRGVDAVFEPGRWALPLHGSICGRVVRTGHPALIPDVSLDPDYFPYPGARARSQLAVPLQIGDRVAGVVNVESPHASAYGIDDLERLAAATAAAAGSFPLETCQLAGAI
jgi:GAF domain-containing protein